MKKVVWVIGHAEILFRQITRIKINWVFCEFSVIDINEKTGEHLLLSSEQQMCVRYCIFYSSITRLHVTGNI